MVEEVKVLPAEIESSRFAEREALEKTEIEVYSAGAGQGIATDIAKGQAYWSGISRRVIEERTSNGRNVGLYRGMRVTDEVGARPCPDFVFHAGSIAKIGAVGHAERCT